MRHAIDLNKNCHIMRLMWFLTKKDYFIWIYILAIMSRDKTRNICCPCNIYSRYEASKMWEANPSIIYIAAPKVQLMIVDQNID